MRSLSSETLELLTKIYNENHAYNEVSEETLLSKIQSYNNKIRIGVPTTITFEEAYITAFTQGLKNNNLPDHISYANGEAYIHGHATGRKARAGISNPPKEITK